MKLSLLSAIVLLATLFQVACAQAPLSPAGGAITPTRGPRPEASWEQQWENVLAAARKEGTVAVYSIWGPTVRVALTQAFREKFALNLEFTPFSRAAELTAKAETEHRAGVYFADVFGTGGGPLVVSLKPAGILGPLEPLLIPPEVTDPKYWMRGRLPFVDKDKTAISLIGARLGVILYNTDLVKRGEIATYKDLLKQPYKGKITMDDPTTSGAGNTLMTHLAVDIWNLEEAKEFLRQLVKEQGVVIQRDQRLHVESVARGKFGVGLSPPTSFFPELIKAGAPVDVVKGPILTAGAANVAVAAKAAHPNAAAVFINWLLSKEGQRAFAQSYDSPALRNDVSTEGINPLFLFQPEEILSWQREEHIFFYDKMAEISKTVIQEATK